MQPHHFWQELLPPAPAQTAAHEAAYPARLADGRRLLLPIRPLGDSGEGLASLIINQASFAVTRALADDLAARLAPLKPDIIVGLPTLGLTLAAAVAEALGHSRYVPLGNSRKFWYEDALSLPVSSITTPGQQKRLYIDPRMLPLLEGRRVALVDDVISSGKSIVAGLSLLKQRGVCPVGIAAAMLQTTRHVEALAAFDAGIVDDTHACFATPLLIRGTDRLWRPA